MESQIYEQIEGVADQIIDETLVEDDKVPSTNEIVTFFKVNHITNKGVTELVENSVLYKKRGVGIFSSRRYTGQTAGSKT